MSVINPNFDPIRDFKARWITTQIDKSGIDYLENLGFYLCDKKKVSDNYTGRGAVTVSQIRNIFGEVKRIESNIEASEEGSWKQDFLFLRPKIAYAAARVLSKDRRSTIKAFKEVLEMAHKEVGDSKDNMRRFAKFFEAIVAYHKVYGGKD